MYVLFYSTVTHQRLWSNCKLKQLLKLNMSAFMDKTPPVMDIGGNDSPPGRGKVIKEDSSWQIKMEEEACNKRRENKVKKQTKTWERESGDRVKLAYKRLLPNVSWQLDRDLPAVGAKLWIHLHYCHAKSFRLQPYSDPILCWVPQRLKRPFGVIAYTEVLSEIPLKDHPASWQN